MKKIAFLSFISLLSLISSCNKSNIGFDNPFPEDTYQRIGFTLNEKEKPTRILKDSEIALVKSTITGDYNKYITHVHNEIDYRSYERAFAGTYSVGYDTANIMKHEVEDIYYQDEKKATPSLEVVNHLRNKTVSTSSNTEDYSYGKISEKVETTSFKYDSSKTSPYIDKFEYGETKEISEDNLNIRIRNKINRNNAKVYTLEDKPYEESTKHSKSDFYIKQNTFLDNPNEYSGANDNDEVILVKEIRSPHGSSGEYQLKDGRKYKAMDNSIVVAKLQLQKLEEKDKISKNDDDFWYLVTYARTYTETTITSEIIDPNVPVKDLANPIVINFEEKISSFFVDKTPLVDTDVLPGDKNL